MSAVPQGSVLGQIFFNILISAIISRVKCTLSKFEDDTKLCGVANTPEGWDVIQRNLDRSEQWAFQYLKSDCKKEGNRLNRLFAGSVVTG